MMSSHQGLTSPQYGQSLKNEPSGSGVLSHQSLKPQYLQQQQHQSQYMLPTQQQTSSLLKTPSVPMAPPPLPSVSYAHSAPPSSSTMASLSTDIIVDHDMPLSPNRAGTSSRFPRDSTRRVGHIHAEQKRRYNIKNGFDMLHSLIPQLQQNPNAKMSKAAMLQKGAEYIKALRAERSSISEKMEILKKERDSLNNSLT